MNNVTRKRVESKGKISRRLETAMQRIVDSYSEDFGVEMTTIQKLPPPSLAKSFRAKARVGAGKKHSRGGNNAHQVDKTDC